MAGVYGADRWERAYGATPTDAWSVGLGHATIDDLLRGVEKASRDDSGRLPTLGVFRMWCREFAPNAFAGASVPSQRALPNLDELAKRTTSGQRWLAFWWHEGLKRRPQHITDEQLAAMLKGADIDDMRRQCKEQRTTLERRNGAAA